MNLEIKYTKTEIETFQSILHSVSTGNTEKVRELMYSLDLRALSRFKQFRKDYWGHQRAVRQKAEA